MGGAWICTHVCRAGSDFEDEDQNGCDSLMAAADYPKSLFNKGVRTQDEEHIGHVMKETDDKIIVFGHYDWRFDVPKDKIIAVGRNVILGMDYADVFKYKMAREAPLPEDTIASY